MWFISPADSSWRCLRASIRSTIEGSSSATPATAWNLSWRNSIFLRSYGWIELADARAVRLVVIFSIYASRSANRFSIISLFFSSISDNYYEIDSILLTKGRLPDTPVESKSYFFSLSAPRAFSRLAIRFSTSTYFASPANFSCFGSINISILLDF